MNVISEKLFMCWTEHLKSVLDDQKINTTSLTTNDHQGIAIAYLTWEKKKIRPRPRQVLKAKDFSCPEYLHDLLNRIEQDFSVGRDVNGYLSHNLAQLNKHDFLLYDWGIHHLHFDDRHCSGLSRKQRSSELIFVVVRPSEVYFLAVQDHGSFADVNLLEIMDENWPELTIPYHFGNDAELSVPIKKVDRQRLRKAGINTPVVLKNGTILMSMLLGGGIACSGVSSDVVDQMLRTFRDFDLLGEYLDFCINKAYEDPMKILFNRDSDFGLATVYGADSQPIDFGVIDFNTGRGATLCSLIQKAKEWESIRFCRRSNIHA